MRIVVTGSRDWRALASVWVPLTGLLERHGTLDVYRGDCPDGLDLLVGEWVTEYAAEGATERVFEADWGRYGNQAGPLRNGEMVDAAVAAGVDAILAWANPCRRRRPWCPPGPHPSHGTADCVQKARAAGIPVHLCPRGMQSTAPNPKGHPAMNKNRCIDLYGNERTEGHIRIPGHKGCARCGTNR